MCLKYIIAPSISVRPSLNGLNNKRPAALIAGTVIKNRIAKKQFYSNFDKCPEEMSFQCGKIILDLTSELLYIQPFNPGIILNIDFVISSNVFLARVNVHTYMYIYQVATQKYN